MTNSASISKIGLLVILLCLPSFAGTPYVVTDNDNFMGNSATAYTLNTASGALTLARVLHTGGVGLGGGSFGSIGVAIASNAHCVFVADTGSNDIAAFAGPGYNLVGRYSNSALNFGGDGGSIALAPDGVSLYGAYSGSLNIGAWAVKSDCSLTFMAAYVPSIGGDFFANLAVAPNGKYLVVSVPDFEAAEFFAIGKDGELIDQGYASFAAIPSCAVSGCYPAAIDITKDSRVVILGNFSSEASCLSVNVGSNGFSNPQLWNLANPSNATGTIVPLFGASGYAGSGALYFGMESGAVVTTQFIESPLSITVTNSTVIPNVNTIAATGDTMLVAEVPDQIGVFRINSNGSLTLLETTTDSNASGVLSLAIYPNTR
jgi:hypothetical protein